MFKTVKMKDVPLGETFFIGSQGLVKVVVDNRPGYYISDCPYNIYIADDKGNYDVRILCKKVKFSDLKAGDRFTFNKGGFTYTKIVGLPYNAAVSNGLGGKGEIFEVVASEVYPVE